MVKDSGRKLIQQQREMMAGPFKSVVSSDLQGSRYLPFEVPLYSREVKTSTIKMG